MRIVGLCNLKGGVGKTTACQNLAVALARRGLRVAALDLDPQSNLTAGFGISVPEEHPYIYDFLLGEASFEEVKITREGVDVVPSTLDLAMVEMQLESQPGRDTLLRDALESASLSVYDCVFCDSPPQLGIFTGTSSRRPMKSSFPWRASFSVSRDSASSPGRWSFSARG